MVLAAVHGKLVFGRRVHRLVNLLVRRKTKIPVIQFDGLNIPHPDRRFDTVMLADVIHHATDGKHLLAEAARNGSRHSEERA